MNCIVRRLLPAFMLWTAVLTLAAPSQAQNATVTTRAAITVLDSTKEQDGLLGSVRRVKTETVKIEFQDGRPVEGPPQLVEITTYGIKGDRIENTSYPLKGGLVGKEEYKYDKRGNITEMTVRDERGAIVSREAYDYAFDKFGNWTKMVTSLVLFENGELKREPIEVTYRTVTYYFDDTVAKIVDEKTVEEPPKPKPQPVQTAPAVPEPSTQVSDQQVLDPGATSTPALSVKIDSEPPPAFRSVPSVVKPNTDNTDATANGLFLAGRDFLNQHKDREAIKAFKESIKLNPNDAEAQYGLGFANFRMGRFRDAADAFKKATVLAPRMAKAHYGLGLAYQELGLDKQLVEEYRILENLDRTLAKKLAQTFPQYNFSCRVVQGCP
ncbi:MAG TPA: tetratricopeptide repeat protein [Pyrinomonadaceae bacterium]|nr:tetratricopeptide repeat protein [Pyrinomonadaceae bacterium]